MKVKSRYHIETTIKDGVLYEHHVEIGTSSWDNSVVSVRNRIDTDGCFNAYLSSEGAIDEVMLMACVAVLEGLVKPETILVLQEAINKYLYDTTKKFVLVKKEEDHA